MTQLRMTQPTEVPAMGRVSLGILLAGVLCLSGCAHMYENVELGKTSLPPHYPHPFEAPVNYGYFPTLWRAWPGAEAVPGQTAGGKTEEEEEKSSEKTPETLPEPEQNTEGATEPGMENVFDLPENAPEMPGEQPQGEAPPETPDGTLPDELIPPQGEAAAQPEEAAPAEAAPEAEQIPDQLIPEAGAAPPPESSSAFEPHNLEELPFDAPEGHLIPDGPQPVAARPRPGLLQPAEKSLRPEGRNPDRIENALRPGARQGAKAMLIEPENAIRELSGGKLKNQPMPEDATDEGPQLMAETSGGGASSIAAEPSTSDEATSSWKAAGRSAGKPRVAATTNSVTKATPQAATVTKAAAEVPVENWRPSRTGNVSQQRSVTRSGVQRAYGNSLRRPAGSDYPGVQTSHTEASPAATPARQQAGADDSANPLR